MSKLSDSKLLEKLKEHFGHNDFKNSLQKSAIKTILKGLLLFQRRGTKAKKFIDSNFLLLFFFF